MKCPKCQACLDCEAHTPDCSYWDYVDEYGDDSGLPEGFWVDEDGDKGSHRSPLFHQR